jgi:hypothetical protein
MLFFRVGRGGRPLSPPPSKYVTVIIYDLTVIFKVKGGEKYILVQNAHQNLKIGTI